MNTLITLNRVYCEHKIDSKKHLLEQIAQKFSLSCPDLCQETLFKAFIERERLGGSDLGRGIAIPHIRVSQTDEPIALFLQLTTGVDYSADDKQPVDLVLALLVPTDADTEHLQLLARIARLFNDEALCKQLRQCHDRTILLQLLENHLQPQLHYECA